MCHGHTPYGVRPHDGRRLPGGEVKLVAEEVERGVPVPLRVGVGLRAVRLELLVLALVLRHAVRPPRLELDLPGEDNLTTA